MGAAPETPPSGSPAGASRHLVLGTKLSMMLVQHLVKVDDDEKNF